MGHVSRGDIGDVYRERMKDDRLLHIVNTIHDWLFAKPAEKPQAEQVESKPQLRIVG